MKIVADEAIPGVEYYFGKNNQITVKSGRLITHADLIHADMLLIRSITKVNKELLQDTTVKFVGSTSAGADHLDTEWLNSAGITWDTAAGCNAEAVAEYVVCVLAALKKENSLPDTRLRAGVVGVGQVGRRVVEQLTALKFEVIQCDPLRAEQEADFPHVPLQELNNLDLITLHVPLTNQGKFPTYHFIDKLFLQKQKKGCILLNAARGEILSFDTLKKYGQHLRWCLDVWENEPHIDHEVLKAAILATPHIAGHSVQAKLRGIEMIYQAALTRKLIAPVEKLLSYPTLSISNPADNWCDAALQVYDPRVTSAQMKQALLTGSKTFDELRKFFSDRHEFNYVKK